MYFLVFVIVLFCIHRNSVLAKGITVHFRKYSTYIREDLVIEDTHLVTIAGPP